MCSWGSFQKIEGQVLKPTTGASFGGQRITAHTGKQLSAHAQTIGFNQSLRHHGKRAGVPFSSAD
jgi:hypothetical protein